MERKIHVALAAVALCATVVAAFLCTGLLSGCAQRTEPTTTEASRPSSQDTDDGRLRVVCATFPAYDWVREVAGEQAERLEIDYLMANGTDLHSYEPTIEDVAKIADADLFVYVGGESDGWALDAVEASGNAGLRTVNMLEAIGDGAVEEELVEGMQDTEHDHDHEAEGEADHDHEHEHEAEYDEHVWLSLRNAQTLVSAIAHELSDVDPEHASDYAANADAYNAKLAELDTRYARAIDAAPNRTVVFADRFPFRYLVDDYGLGYYAAFAGCSAETEASFETVAFLSDKLDELGLDAVLVIEKSDQTIARTVTDNTASGGQRILVLDSLQSATQEEVDAGKTYLGTMEQNLEVLTTALA